jgi:hypothetical protein
MQPAIRHQIFADLAERELLHERLAAGTPGERPEQLCHLLGDRLVLV